MTHERKPVVLHDGQGQWLNWLGHPVRYLATGTDTGQHYCASVSTTSAGDGSMPHRHEFDEGFYILSGDVEITAGRRTVALTGGEFAGIGAGTPHSLRVTSPTAGILTIAAPAGFDSFQRLAGEVLSHRDATPTKTVEDVRRGIDQHAAAHGIDMQLPREVFDVEPEIRIARLADGDVVDAVGDRYRFLAEGEHTRGRYALWHATISPGGGPPFHRHAREEEGFFVLSGEITFEANGTSFNGGAGTFVNLPIGSLHRFSNPTNQPAEVLILVAPAGLEKMFRRTGQVVTDRTSPITPPSDDEKKRLVKIAPEFGIELHLPAH